MLGAAPGERLRVLRELFGFTQARLAKACGVRQSWISEVERGDEEPTEDKLRVIADATGTPMTFFYVTPSSVPLDSLRFRKLAATKKSTTTRVHAFYSESFRVTEDLLTSERYPMPALPYATGEQITQSQIEQHATDTREALRLAPDRPIPHLTRALERAGVAVAPIVLTDSDGGEQHAPGHFGVSYWSGLGGAALVGYFPGQGDRERFTLAHELAHCVLHTFRPRTPAAAAEDEANRFAAALLIPYARAVQDLSDRLSLSDFARLKATWGASIQCHVMRGYAIGALSETRKHSLFVQLSARGWRKNEPVLVGNESPRLLWTLLSRRFGPKPYITAAEPLAIPPAVLRSIAPSQSRSPATHKGGPDFGEVIPFRQRPDLR